MRSRGTIALLLSLLLAGAAAGQDWRRFRGGWGRGMRIPPRMATADSFDGSFNFCRVMFSMGRREAGGSGWSTDYPDADINFSIRLAELTKARVSRQPSGQPNHLVVRLTDDELFQCPIIHLEDVGTMSLTDLEIQRLREYLLKGGFAWADDFWGPWAWEAWVAEISQVLPPGEYPIQDLTPEHPIYRTLFQFDELPQVPSIQFWRQSGGLTSERGDYSGEAHIRGISDRRGRLMVLMTHNTDISDAWEREGEDPRFFYSFSPDGYAVGINVLMYAMSH
jgi:hypothetical protein